MTNDLFKHLRWILLFVFSSQVVLLTAADEKRPDDLVIFQTGYELSSCFGGHPVVEEMVVSKDKIICIQRSRKHARLYISNAETHPLKEDFYKKLLNQQEIKAFFNSPQTFEVIEKDNSPFPGEIIVGPAKATRFWTVLISNSQNHEVSYTKKSELNNSQSLPFRGLQKELNSLMLNVCGFQYQN